MIFHTAHIRSISLQFSNSSWGASLQQDSSHKRAKIFTFQVVNANQCIIKNNIFFFLAKIFHSSLSFLQHFPNNMFDAKLFTQLYYDPHYSAAITTVVALTRGFLICLSCDDGVVHNYDHKKSRQTLYRNFFSALLCY